MKGHDQAREILKHLANCANDTYKEYDNKNHILLVLTGKGNSIESALRDIPKIKRYGFSVDIALSSSAEKIIEDKNISIPLQVEKVLTEKEENLMDESIQIAKRIVVPSITQNTAIKLSKGIQDQFIPSLLWQCLWKGKSVLINFNQLLNYKGSSSQQPFLEEMIKENIAKLKKMGVMSLDEKEYYLEFLDNGQNTIKSKEKVLNNTDEEDKNIQINKYQKVITKKDISLLPNSQKQINFPKDAIITPLAYDKAKEKGIQLIKG